MFIQEPPPQPLPAVTELATSVLVTARGIPSGSQCGAYNTSIVVLARTPEGRTEAFFVVDCGIKAQGFPAIGSRCVFYHRPGHPGLVEGMEVGEGLSGQLVERFECEDTTPLLRP